jgi:hypothetical protein
MDSTDATKTAGKTGSYTTGTNRKEVRRLRNYLFKIFEIYIAMNLSHSHKFSNCEVEYINKKFFVRGLSVREYSKITDVAWHLFLHFHIKAPQKYEYLYIG